MTAKQSNVGESRTKLDPQEYNRLVAHAKVQAIRLIDARYNIKPDALSTQRDDLAYNVSNRLLDWHCDNDALTLSGTWEYTATCLKGRKNLLVAKAKFLVTYRLSAECDPAAGQQFFERVGRFAAYPYFRSTFAVLTQQSGIILHPLPVLSEQPRWVTPPPDLVAPKSQVKLKARKRPAREPQKGA